VDVHRQHLGVQSQVGDGFFDEDVVDRADVADALGDDQVRVDGGEGISVDGVDAVARLRVGHHIVYLRAGGRRVDAGAG